MGWIDTNTNFVRNKTIIGLKSIEATEAYNVTELEIRL